MSFESGGNSQENITYDKSKKDSTLDISHIENNYKKIH